MTDITFKVLDSQTIEAIPLAPVIKDSAEIVLFTQFSSLRSELLKLETIYNNLISSLPSNNLHDREAL
jgi:hypothetical protein